MKVTYQVTPRLTFEVEGDHQKDVFKKLAQIDAIFGINMCPMTKSTNLKFVVKEVDGNEYYEIHDRDNPGVMMQFGQHKTGNTMFPRKNKESGHVWFKWSGKPKPESEEE